VIPVNADVPIRQQHGTDSPNKPTAWNGFSQQQEIAYPVAETASNETHVHTLLITRKEIFRNYQQREYNNSTQLLTYFI